MGQKIFLDSIYQSMQDSARQVRLSLGPCRTLHGRCASHWGVHHRELRDSKHYSKLQC